MSAPRFALVLALAVGVLGSLPWAAHAKEPAASAATATARVSVPIDHIRVDDGDSIHVDGPDGVETIRLLGIDCPEVQHLQHDIPFDQPMGRQARAFLEGCLAASESAQVLRAGEKDPFGRTLGYLFLDGHNYSVLVLKARYAIESVSRYGDNGLPNEAASCLAAGRAQGAVAFEDPRTFRRRMKKVARRMQANGTYPSVVAPR